MSLRPVMMHCRSPCYAVSTDGHVSHVSTSNGWFDSRAPAVQNDCLPETNADKCAKLKGNHTSLTNQTATQSTALNICKQGENPLDKYIEINKK